LPAEARKAREFTGAAEDSRAEDVRLGPVDDGRSDIEQGSSRGEVLVGSECVLGAYVAAEEYARVEAAAFELIDRLVESDADLGRGVGAAEDDCDGDQGKASDYGPYCVRHSHLTTS